MSDPALTLVFPAYREAGRLARSLDAARRFLEGRLPTHEIIVAVDGSDATLEVARAEALRDPRVSVMAAPERRGKGRAVREAMARARGRFVGYMDADGKVPFEEIAGALDALEEGWDVVVGSRRAAGASVEAPRPLHRRLGSRGFQAAVWLLLPPLRGVRDTQCGFKFFRAEAARALFPRQRVDGYMFDVEILLLASTLGLRVQQRGLRWQDDGDSRLDLVAGNWRNLVDLLRIRRRGARAQAEAKGTGDAPSAA